MNNTQKTELKAKILKRYELYKLQSSRLKRILKDPFRTIPYFIMQTIAYKHPFKVSYTTLWGDKMRFYLPEGNAIYYYGFFEANLTNFFINFLKEGDTFMDIGAHVGFYTLLARNLVGEKGQIHSFEPTPTTFNTLSENVAGKTNVFVNNFAVLNEQTTIDFYDYGRKYSAFNSFQKRTSDEMKFLEAPTVVRIPTISIDTYCKDKDVTPLLIKIDAEGAEHLILSAMTEVLANKKPIVTIEVAGGDEWKDNCKRSIDTLKSFGYELYELTLEGMLKAHTAQDTYSYDNLILVHPEKKHILTERNITIA